MIQPLVAAALLLAQAYTGPADPVRPCITHEEAADVAVSLLPYLLDAAAQRCRPHLADGAFLQTGAADWSARLRREGAPRRASALRGIGKMGGVAPPNAPDGEAGFEFVAQLLTAGLIQAIPPENCAQIDTIAQSLSPLPTDNIARLVGAGVTLAMTANRRQQAGDGGASGAGEDADPDSDPEGGDGPPICPA